MNVVNSRVISLSLDATRLKTGVDAALNSLKLLDSAITKSSAPSNIFSSIRDGLPNIAKGFDGLISKIQNFTSQFPVLQAAASVAIGNIVSNLVSSVGNKLMQSMFQGLNAGFAEYELNMKSVQTILANTKSKGEDIKSVTDTLDDLNQYADQTIYNFAEMTKNIGMFTAAGVGLRDSAVAIKGISNLAAMSGSTSQQASTAMYQLSQALSSGTVKLMDWNSVVNAGMGGEQFQQALIRTAKAQGQAVEESIAKAGTFRESLKDGWLTAEVLTETLSMLTLEIENLNDEQLIAKGYKAEDIALMRDMAKTAHEAATAYKTFSDVSGAIKETIGSGWAKTWQILVGDFEEAKALWTAIGNYVSAIVDGISDMRNGILQAFKDAGGRTAILDTMYNLFKAIETPVKIIVDTFREVFNASPIASMMGFVNALRDITSGLIMTEHQAGLFRNVMTGIFELLKLILTPIFALVVAVGTVLSKVLQIGIAIGGYLLTGILTVASGIVDLIRAFGDFMKWLDPVGNTLKLLGGIFLALQTVWKTFVSTINSSNISAITKPIEAMKNLGSTVMTYLSPAIDKLKRFLSILGVKISDPYGPIAGSMWILVALGTRLGEAFVWLANIISSVFKAIWSYIKPVLQVVGGFIVQIGRDIVDAIPPQIVSSIKAIFDALMSLGDVNIPLSESFYDMKDALEAFIRSLRWIIGIDILSIFEGIGSGLSGVWSRITALDFGGLLSSLGSGFETVKQFIVDAFKNLGNSVTTEGGNMLTWLLTLPNTIRGIALGILDAIRGVGDWFVTTFPNSIGVFVRWIGDAFGGLKGWFSENSAMIMGLVSQGVALGGIFGLFKGIFGVLDGVKEVRKSPFADILTALDTIKELGTKSIDAFKESMDGFQKAMKPYGILAIALAILALAASMWVLSKVPIENVWNSFASLGGALAGIVFVMKQLDKLETGSGDMLKLTFSLLLLSAAVGILGLVASRLGSMSVGSIIQGGIAVTALIGVVSGFLYLLKYGSTLNPKEAFALIIVATAVWLLGAAAALLGKLPLGQLVLGVTVVATLMAIMAGFMFLLKYAPQLKITDALMLLAVTVTIVVIAGVVALLGLMPLEMAQQGMIMLGTVMGMMVGMLIAFGAVKNAAQIGLMMLSLSLLILSVAAVLVIFSSMGFERWLPAAIMLALTFAMIVVAVNMINGSLAGVVGLIIVAAALLVIAVAINVVAAVPWYEAAAGMIILIIALVALIAVAALAQSFVVGMAAIAAVFIALGIAAIMVAGGVLIFVIALGLLIPVIIGLVGALLTLSSSAGLMSSEFVNMAGLAVILTTLGVAFVAFGAGAIVAGAGILVLAVGLMVLSTALAMLTAVAPASVLAIQAFVEGLAAISLFDMGKATVNALALGAMAIPLTAFGLAAVVVAAGLIALAAAIALLMWPLTMITPAVKVLVDSLVSLEPIISILASVGKSFIDFGTSVAKAAVSMLTLSITLSNIVSLSVQLTSSVRIMAMTTTTSFMNMNLGVKSVSASLRTGVENIRKSMNIMLLAIQSNAPKVGSAFKNMATVSQPILTSFTLMLVTTRIAVVASIDELASAILGRSTIVANSFGRMVTVSNVQLTLFRNTVSHSAKSVGVGLNILTISVNRTSSNINKALSRMGAYIGSAFVRINSSLRQGVVTAVRLVDQLPRGIQNASRSASNSATTTANNLVRNLIQTLIGNMPRVYLASYDLGYQIVRGLTNGINDNSSQAITAASNTASKALSSAKSVLGVHSPSREFYKIGRFVDEGFANGINQNSDIVTTASSLLAQSVIDEAERILGEHTQDFNPTITPVLDMSQVESNATKLNGMFRTPSLIPTGDVEAAQNISTIRNSIRTTDVDPISRDTARGNVTFNYTQNNTSPKALSSLEIYRQTQNQIKTVKGALKKL